MSFAREPVIRALTSVGAADGEEYLKKIVQVAFDVPVIEQERLKSVLLQEIRSAIPDFETDAWNLKRFQHLHAIGLAKLVQNIRDIKRYASSLSFNIALVKAEIDMMDFFGLEALRVFEPAAYKFVHQNEWMFVGFDDVYDWHEPSWNEEQIDRLLQPVVPDKDRRSAVIGIFRYLFPSDRADGADESRSICNATKFSRYFLLSVESDDLSASHYTTLLSKIASPQNFRVAVSELQWKAKYAFRRRIKKSQTQLDADQQKQLLKCLIESADLLALRHGWIEEEFHLLVDSLLHRLNLQEATDLMIAAVGDTLNVGYIFDYLEHLETVSPPWAAKQLVKRVRARAEKRLQGLSAFELAKLSRLFHTLLLWKEMKPIAADQGVARLLETSESALLLASDLLTPKTITYADDENDPYALEVHDWEMSLASVKKLLTIKQLHDALSSPSVVSEKQKKAIDEVERLLLVDNP